MPLENLFRFFRKDKLNIPDDLSFKGVPKEVLEKHYKILVKESALGLFNIIFEKPNGELNLPYNEKLRYFGYLVGKAEEKS